MFIIALILWGFIAGHRLAWQWGVVLGTMFAIIWALVAVVGISNANQGGNPSAVYLSSGLVMLMSMCLLTITFSLFTSSARDYFCMRCPTCHRFSATAGDFFFSTVKCKRCRETW